MNSTRFPRRALFVRLDRIGDLVLTLPVDEGLESVHWWIPQRLSFVTQGARPRRNASEVGKKVSWSEFRSLLRTVKSQAYDCAVVFHAPWWVGCLLWMAGIPLRIGVRSQWHSFLFFNRGIRQKRSRADKSELEFNYRLVEEGLRLPEGTLPRKHLKLDAEDAAVLSRFGLTPGQYAVVHPGMGGSARNWPTERYADLVREVSKSRTVVITGTAADADYVNPLRDVLVDQPGVLWLNEKLNGPELVAVLGGAGFVFAPSTGVLHLAASTGVATIGLFSPVRVQRDVRWGPQGENTTTLTPQVDCPGELKCLREACPYWDCMPMVTVEDVLAAAKKF